MKALAVAVTFLLALNSVAIGLLQIPVCCMHKESCPMHRPATSSTPSCHHSDSASDSTSASLQNCDPMKVSTTLIEPAVLPANDAYQSTAMTKTLAIDSVPPYTPDRLPIPKQPPRI